MTTKDYCSINFTGMTHDHSIMCNELSDKATTTDCEEDSSLQINSHCSAIAILKRHPMYDCLILVKKYRDCLGGYSLEFPVDKTREHERIPTNESAHHHHDQKHESESEAASEREVHQPQQVPPLTVRRNCNQRRLVSRFLDGDDPMYRAVFLSPRNSSSLSLASDQGSNNAPGQQHTDDGEVSAQVNVSEQPQQLSEEFTLPFMSQIDDRGEQCNLVHVPINGLLDRLESYTRNGVAVDSRVYAFAMGLKTAERMMTTKSMKELQETPI